MNKYRLGDNAKGKTVSVYRTAFEEHFEEQSAIVHVEN